MFLLSKSRSQIVPWTNVLCAIMCIRNVAIPERLFHCFPAIFFQAEETHSASSQTDALLIFPDGNQASYAFIRLPFNLVVPCKGCPKQHVPEQSELSSEHRASRGHTRSVGGR